MDVVQINLDEHLKSLLSQGINFVEDDGKSPVFINWLGEADNEPKDLLHQVKTLENFITQKRRIFLFDRDRDLREQHVKYLQEKGNIVLAEPCLLPRRGFMWWPHPIETFDDPPLKTQEKKYDLYVPDGDMNALEMFKLIRKEIPQITYGSEYEKARCVILYYKLRDTYKGYLEPIDHYFKAYCFPIIYIRHRFFHSLFGVWVTPDIPSIRWLIMAGQNGDYGWLKDLYWRVNNWWPEMRLINSISVLKEQLSV